MATTIAELVAVIGADVTGLRRGMSEAKTQMNSFAGGLGNVGSQMTELGLRMQVVAGPLRDGFSAGIGAAMGFENVMAELQARTGLTGDEMVRVRDLAIEMGAETAFSATDAAEAMLQLVSSGASVEEAMAMLPPVLDAAAAGGLGLGEAADAVTDIMASFSLEVGAAGDVADALAKAAGASSAEMSGMVQGFQNVGPVANNFGLTVEEAAAALAIFNDAGIKGAEAGTQLRSMLNNMTRDTEAVQDAWKTLGSSMYDAEGNLRSLDVVIGEINTAMADMTDEERNGIIRDLAGAYGQMGLSALLASGGISPMVTKMRESADVSDVARARMDTLSGRIESLQGSLEALAIESLTPLMDNVLKPLIDQHIIPLVNSLTDWVSKNPALAQGIVLVAGGLTVLGPLLFGLGQIVAVGGPLVGGLGAVVAGLYALMGPIGVVSLAVVGLTAAFAALLNKTDAFKAEQPTLVGLATDLKGSLDTAGRSAEVITVGAGGEVGRIGVGSMTSATGPLPGESADDFFRRESGNAQGGKVFGGQLYKWQERGVEAFVPAVDGTVMPAHRLQGMMSGGGAIQVTGPIYIQGVQDVAELLRQLEAEARRKAKRLLQ